MSNIKKNQTYSILWLNSQGWDNEKIMQELTVSNDQIKKTLEKYEIINQDSKKNIKTTSSVSRSKNLMITETSGKRQKTIAIMTKEASELNDELKKTNVLPNLNKQKIEKNIFRPSKE